MTLTLLRSCVEAPQLCFYLHTWCQRSKFKCNITLLITCKCLPVCTITHTAIDIATKEEEHKVDSDTPPGMFIYYNNLESGINCKK